MSQESLSPSVESPFIFQSNPIRTQLENDQLWFAAKDVCSALAIGWNGTSLASIPDEWQGMRYFRTPSGNQRLRSITEPAVYKLAFRSNKPEADTFTNWVASEVIPAIRNTGKFEAPAALPDTSPLTQSSRAELKAIVDAKLSTYPSDIQGKARSEIWTRFNRHFKIAEYAQLPMCQMPDARDYLVEMKPNALATIEAKPEPAALPPSSVPATRGRHRVKSSTEEQLSELLDEAYHLRDARIEFNKLFDKLSVITGPLYKQALASMRRTDDNVCTDSLIQTLHYHRWDANESIRDAANAAREACRSAIVVARLLGV